MDMITSNSHPWIMFSFKWLIIVIIILSGRGRGVRLKLDVQGQEGGRILNVDGKGGWAGLENWTIFMDVICVSSLNNIMSRIICF